MEGSAATPNPKSAISAEQETEYSQSFGTSAGPENRVVHARLAAKRNDSQIMPPFLHDEVEERPNKSHQSWPWKDRAFHSDIFEPLDERDKYHAKNTKKWPWQDRAAISHVFDGNNNVEKGTKKTESREKGIKKPESHEKVTKKGECPEKNDAVTVTEEPSNSENKSTSKPQWPWQSRAMTSEIFGDSDAPKQRKHKEYSWHQGKSTHNHKVDGSFDGVTQYMKDFNQSDSQKYLGPRHGYKYLLKRRDNTATVDGGGETDFVSQITKMNLEDAAAYMKEAEKKLGENPEQYS